MNEIKDYRIVWSYSPIELTSEVVKLLDDGWQPLEHLAVTTKFSMGSPIGTAWIQVMVRYKTRADYIRESDEMSNHLPGIIPASEMGFVSLNERTSAAIQDHRGAL